MEKQYNYTIIIPHYKIIDLLGRALSSIPDRDDIQILVVDDNSGIEKSEFDKLNIFQKASCEFVLSQESKGAGGARNIGLKYAVGKWLLFADADDFFAKNAFEFFDKYLDSEYDIVYFDTASVFSDTLEPSPRNKIYNAYVALCDNKTEDKINLIRFGHSVPYAKMIRHDVVRNHGVVFDETRYCNDTMFSMKTALYAKKVFVDKQVVYYVTNRSGSLITNPSKEAVFIRYEVILRVNKFLRENNFHKYQNTLLTYLLQFFKFGILSLLKAIVLGIKYNAYNIHTLYGTSHRVRLIYKNRKCL